MSQRLLVVDDEPAIRSVVENYMALRGFAVESADSCHAAEDTFLRQRPDAVIIDYQLPDGNALELLPRLRSVDPALPVVILTGFGSIDLAVRAIQEGADHFLTKPVELQTLAVILDRLVEGRRSNRQRLAGKAARGRESVDPFLGTSPAIQQLAERARRVSTSESPVLIQGETGSGKGVLARWLHDHGPRAEEAFVDVNCAGLSREFLETELFGHEKGAFTGATGPKTGLLEVAHKGTVFLDEIGDVDLQVQPKLLKVLEERRFRRLGSVQDRLVDVRLIAAAHQDLERLVEDRSFRSDLFYRINTIVLHVPPLRERREDVLPLARHFLGALAAQRGRGAMAFSPEAEAALTQHHWPGNIRELRNVIERIVLLCQGETVGPEDLGLNRRSEAAGSRGIDTTLTLDELERRQIEAVLHEEHGRIESAAKRLGLHRSSLYGKLKKYSLPQS